MRRRVLWMRFINDELVKNHKAFLSLKVNVNNYVKLIDYHFHGNKPEKTVCILLFDM